MDDDEVQHEFVNMAMNEYAQSMEQFIEGTRVLELQIRDALNGDEHVQASVLSQKLFFAVSGVQVGNIHNLITSYAHRLNDERAAGIELLEILSWHLDLLKQFHAHLVYIGQPNEELLMVTDMMNNLEKAVEESTFGQMAKELE